MTAQAILTFDKALQIPRDLSGIAVGINEYTGSHYTTLQMLEGVVGRDKVVTHRALAIIPPSPAQTLSCPSRSFEVTCITALFLRL